MCSRPRAGTWGFWALWPAAWQSACAGLCSCSATLWNRQLRERHVFPVPDAAFPAFHLLEALESMPDLFQKFGGHRQAAGLTLHAGQLEEFRQRFDQFAASKLTVDDLRPEYIVDAEAEFSELTERCIRDVLTIGPFGFANPAPIFYTAGVEVAGPFKTFKDGKHLSVSLRDRRRTLFCKAWNFGDRLALLSLGQNSMCCFRLRMIRTPAKRLGLMVRVIEGVATEHRLRLQNR